MNRALLVGINAYADRPLRGCVNDISDMAQFLTQRCKFKASDIRMLADSRATNEAIRDRLDWLMDGIKPGDRILFHFSGHGAQVATRSSKGEVDGLDEVICPYDFEWSGTRMIRDKEFNKMFSAVPEGVEFLWISDSCHSGDLVTTGPLGKSKKNSKSLPPPADLGWRLRIASEKKMSALSINNSAKQLNVALLSGCKSNQTSADTNFKKRYNGAFTYYLLRELNKSNGLTKPLSAVVKDVSAALRKARYSQEPQLEGHAGIIKGPFLK
ncbi:MAG: caspase domain-containing protein [Cytophagales bacterium]